MAKIKRLGPLELKRIQRLVEGELYLTGSSAWAGVETCGMELFSEHIADPQQCQKAINKFVSKLTTQTQTWHLFVVSFFEFGGRRFHESDEYKCNNITTKEFDLYIKDAVEASLGTSEFTQKEWRGYVWYASISEREWEGSENDIVSLAIQSGVYDQEKRKRLVEEYYSEKAEKERTEARKVLASIVTGKKSVA